MIFTQNYYLSSIRHGDMRYMFDKRSLKFVTVMPFSGPRPYK